MSDKKNIIVITRSIFAELPWLALFLISLILTIVLTMFGIGVQDITIASFSFDLSIFSLISLVFLFIFIHKVYDRKYFIGDNYIRSVKGIFSLKEVDVRIDFDSIIAIEVDANLYDRIFSIGNIVIGCEANNNIEVTLKGVRNPNRVREIIEARMKAE